jgi:hypothetical protein
MYRRTVSTICTTICEQQHERREVAGVVLASFNAMPRLVRMGVWTATMAFGAAGRFYGSRAQQWCSWRAHRLGAARDLVRLYESLVMMALYSHLERRPVE